jgi:hypothetical protein
MFYDTEELKADNEVQLRGPSERQGQELNKIEQVDKDGLWDG